LITDALVNFLPPGSNVAITTVDVPSNVIDLLGLGVGVVAPAAASAATAGLTGGNAIIGNRTVFGADMGIGGVKPLVECAVGTAFTTSAGATLNCKFQGAIDDGTGNPGTWRTLIETGAMAVADLGANAVFGRFDFPPAFPVNFQPRFLRLLFSPSATMTAGTVANAVVTMGRPDNANRYMPANYKVAG